MVAGVGKYYLYRHVRTDKNVPFYIGIGTKPSRYTCPKVEFSRAYQGGKYRGKIWNDIAAKTGYEVEILLETDNYEFLLQKEIELVALYGRISNNTGLLANLSEGGLSSAKGIKWSQESRSKLSISKIGTKRSPEVIRKQVEARKANYTYTDEHKRKISESNKKHHKHQKGKKLSEETKAKIRIASLSRPIPRWVIDKATEVKKKKIMCVDDNIVFNSVREAAEYAGVSAQHFTTTYKKGKRIKNKKYELFRL